ncbi:DNA repair protein RecN [Aquihabitans sp. G128]|uniref:DNA repair protein RecN n=1 Tax=Aquihabitans sp. G128 TaxID=2849779 RepID=UPI001C212DC3|nr:DNA repair protein RecN [Aquihabitans sp. G128]QXC62029.1 DNA repair protein RecN [Aquihabitans sp. G128]
MSAPVRPVAPRGRLVELAVTDLGIIDHLSLVLGPGMTALTGETGAGKTMVVGAIDLLLGGRADAGLVRAGASEAVVEGRFDLDGEELILTRIVPAEGRSRAYVNGRMATAAALADEAVALVDLHGQHAHQSLLATRTQRDALDRFAGVDLAPLEAARAERRSIAEELGTLGGDAGARAREADLLRFQLGELDGAGLEDPDEDRALDELEDLLAGAVSHREVAGLAVAALTEERGAGDGVGVAIAALDGHAPFALLVERLRSTQAELADVAAEVRASGEAIDDDPERLAGIRERRQLLVDLRRKYGTAPVDDEGRRTGGGTLHDVIAYRDAVAERLERLESHDARAAALEARLAEADQREAKAAAAVGKARRKAAPALARAVEGHLRDLAMPNARLQVAVGAEDPGDDVAFLLAANPGVDPAPLTKVASGGELARSMLALRLVLSEAPPVLVFDEVDAGIGGQAALAVGRSLAALGADHQVLVVTHLPQVAAFADQQVHVRKAVRGGTTVAGAATLDGDDRVVELSRMLSGTPDSERVQGAAAELLALASKERGR